MTAQVPPALLAAVRVARPRARLRTGDAPADELVLHGGGEVLRLPLTAEAAQRVLLAARVLPRLRSLVPVPVPVPRPVGVLPDGSVFTAEPRLPGVRPVTLGMVATGQLAGLRAALDAVPEREAQQWGLPGTGPLRHGALSAWALLVDPRRGVLTGVVGWAPRLGGNEQLDPLVAGALGLAD